MRTPELKAVAASLADAGAPGLPTVVLAREVPVLEVEFAGAGCPIQARRHPRFEPGSLGR